MTLRATVLASALACAALTAWGSWARGPEARAWGQEKSDAPAPQIGLAVGEKAPPFKLHDQAGKERSLEEMLHEGAVAVVFFRSANW